MSKSKIAIAITFLWIVTGVIFVIYTYKEPMKLNEIGDFLAGFFSPIAFLWLIIGYFQQGEELKLNTKALELQVNELRLSVEQQKELVEVTRADMLLSKESHEREKAKEIRLSQPFFSLHTSNYNGSSHAIHSLEATLTNHGNEATSLKLSCSKGEILESEISVISRGDARQIHFLFPNEPVDSFLTSIEYCDGLGVIRKKKISSIVNEYDTLVFLAPTEDNDN